MVSINISTSFQGTSKTEESSNDADTSELDNIFASTLAVIEEENNLVSKGGGFQKSDDTMLLLEEIKKKLGLTSSAAALKEGKTNPENLSENILQIYQTYKALIDDTINIENDATITFDMEKILEPYDTETENSLVDQSKSKAANNLSKLDLVKVNTVSNDTLLDDSIEKFSELEMQRIKGSMRQEDQINIEAVKNSGKKKSSPKNKPSMVSPNFLDSNDNKASPSQNKVLPFLEQSKVDVTGLNATLDGSKAESLLDQTQTSAKPVTNKLSSAESTLQSNQNAYETQLKLLEKNWGKDLAKIIEKAITSGKEKIDISLDPQKLGKMHLTLSVVNNQTSIFISTETAAASLILSSAEDRLAQMFESSGYKLSNFQANSNGNGNSSNNGSTAGKDKKQKVTASLNEPIPLTGKENNSSYSIDGRKIINLIA